MFTTRRQLRDHEKKRHQMVPVITPNNGSNQTFDATKSNFFSSTCACHLLPCFLFDHLPTNRFSRMVEETSFTRAISYLIKKAGYQISNDHEVNALPDPHPLNIKLFIEISKLVSNKGTCSNIHLENLLQSFVVLVAPLLPCWVPLPASQQSFSQMITNLTNKNSLFSNLPIQPPTPLADGHASLSLSSILALRMLMPENPGIRLSHPKVQSLMSLPWISSNTQPCSASCQYPHWNVFLILWSDGWDPSQSTKSNRNPVWSMSVTMLIQDIALKKALMCFTDLYAIGPGGKSDHSCVVRNLVNEIGGSGSTNRSYQHIYHSGQSRHIKIKLNLGVVLQDQPERRSMCGLLAGNSVYHALFGLSCNFGILNKPFPACNGCMMRVNAYVADREWDAPIYNTRNDQCQKCHGWCLSRLTNNGEYHNNGSDTVHSNVMQFQRKHCPDSDSRLGHHPNFLTPGSLKSAWQMAIDGFCHSRVLSEAEVKLYLSMHCFNGASVKDFVRRCTNVMNLADCRDRPHMVPDAVFLEATMKNHEEKPEDYVLPTVPAMLELLPSLEFCPETPMHQLMGITKAVFTMVLEWASHQNNQASLIRDVNVKLDQVQQLSLDQFRAIQISGDKFGGYVAENYKCISVLGPWLFSCLGSKQYQPATKQNEPPSGKPVDAWTLSQCRAWVENREIQLPNNLRVSEVRMTIANLIQADPTLKSRKDDIRPPRISGQRIRELIQKLFLVQAAIMGSDESGTRGANRSTAYAMQFLSIVDEVDRSLNPGRKTPIWLSKYNFVSLLRTCQHFKRYHLVRNLYEGGPEGAEGIVKQLRPFFPSCIRMNWATSFMERYQRESCLEHLSRKCSHTSPDVSLDNTMHTKDLPIPEYRYRRYRSSQQIQFLLEQGSPLSAVTFQQGDQFLIGCVLTVGRMRFLSQLQVSETAEYRDELGLTYFHVNSVLGNSLPITNGYLDVLPFQKHVLLLPIKVPIPLAVGPNFAYALLDDEMSFYTGAKEWSVP